MLRLREIMTKDLVTVSPDLSLRDALDVFTRQHISGAPVVSNRRVVGVISLTDFAEFAAASPGVPTERHEMSDPDEWEDELLPIEDGEPPAAFFAEMWDDSGADVVERMAQSHSPEWNTLEEHTVGEVMNRAVAHLPPDVTVDRAAGFMREAGIHRVLIMEGDNLLGMVTTTDITNAVADGKVTNNVYVFGARAGARGA